MKTGNVAVGLCNRRERLPKGSLPKYSRFDPFYIEIGPLLRYRGTLVTTNLEVYECVSGELLRYSKGGGLVMYIRPFQAGKDVGYVLHVARFREQGEKFRAIVFLRCDLLNQKQKSDIHAIET